MITKLDKKKIIWKLMYLILFIYLFSTLNCSTPTLLFDESKARLREIQSTASEFEQKVLNYLGITDINSLDETKYTIMFLQTQLAATHQKTEVVTAVDLLIKWAGSQPTNLTETTPSNVLFEKINLFNLGATGTPDKKKKLKQDLSDRIISNSNMKYVYSKLSSGFYPTNAPNRDKPPTTPISNEGCYIMGVPAADQVYTLFYCGARDQTITTSLSGTTAGEPYMEELVYEYVLDFQEVTTALGWTQSNQKPMAYQVNTQFPRLLENSPNLPINQNILRDMGTEYSKKNPYSIAVKNPRLIEYLLNNLEMPDSKESIMLNKIFKALKSFTYSVDETTYTIGYPTDQTKISNKSWEALRPTNPSESEKELNSKLFGSNLFGIWSLASAKLLEHVSEKDEKRCPKPLVWLFNLKRVFDTGGDMDKVLDYQQFLTIEKKKSEIIKTLEKVINNPQWIEVQRIEMDAFSFEKLLNYEKKISLCYESFEELSKKLTKQEAITKYMHEQNEYLMGCINSESHIPNLNLLNWKTNKNLFGDRSGTGEQSSLRQASLKMKEHLKKESIIAPSEGISNKIYNFILGGEIIFLVILIFVVIKRLTKKKKKIDK